MIKKIFINAVIILLILVSIDFYVFKHPHKDSLEFINNFNKSVGTESIKYSYGVTKKYIPQMHLEGLRPVNYGKSKKNPIVFIGCSYMYGSLLENNQTLPYKISKLTGRTTYNEAESGSGPNNTLYQMEHSKQFDEIKNADYVIYAFIGDHLNRLYNYLIIPFANGYGYFVANTRYELNNGELKYIEPQGLIFYYSYIVRRIQEDIAVKKGQDFDKSFDLLRAILLRIQSNLKKNSPNIKMVFIMYKDTGGFIPDEKQIKLLENDGFIVIDAEKLVGHELMSAKWRAGDKEHPSEAAWNDFAPKLVEKLKL